jgi:hypothetical protein
MPKLLNKTACREWGRIKSTVYAASNDPEEEDYLSEDMRSTLSGMVEGPCTQENVDKLKAFCLTREAQVYVLVVWHILPMIDDLTYAANYK